MIDCADLRLRLRRIAVGGGVLLLCGLSAGCVTSIPDAPVRPTLPTTVAPVSSPTPAITTPSVTPEIGKLIESATWITRDDGPTLAIDPSEKARTGTLEVLDAAWDEVIALFPDADTPSMRMQFDCHRVGAMSKETWNLEPWRDDVSRRQMLLMKCNP